MINTPITNAIEMIKKGDLDEAEIILNKILADNPSDINALLWKTETTNNVKIRKSLLNQILRIDPENIVAKKGLSLLPQEEDELPSWLMESSVEQNINKNASSVQTKSGEDLIKIKKKIIKIESDLKDWNRTLNNFNSSWIGITTGVLGLIMTIFGYLYRINWFVIGLFILFIGLYLIFNNRNKKASIIKHISNLEIQESKLRNELLAFDNKEN